MPPLELDELELLQPQGPLGVVPLGLDDAVEVVVGVAPEEVDLAVGGEAPAAEVVAIARHAGVAVGDVLRLLGEIASPHK